ncbi:stage II sporulation protein M [Halorussus salilacus]|uniref:stage II sporulation protein M n=1 Tax=Halorussus salilacus TaxID=2953750 RepID=UPI00209DE5CB|nr:stage II sporulation protein M [Halorussus salilacus]USZ69181.1 stage II sporulation protein M [Halorussus salilacus]
MSKLPSRIVEAIRRNHLFILASSVVYFSGVIVGILAVSTIELESVPTFVESYRVRVDGTMTIFETNATVLTTVLAGALTFSGTSLVGLFTSGFVHAAVLVSLPVSVFEFGKFFVPHALVELPAVWIGGSVGLRIPYELVQFLRGVRTESVSKREVIDMLLLTIVAYVGIALAAVIEGALLRYVT